jgi:NADH-quinone oxidoreductase subunit E
MAVLSSQDRAVAEQIVAKYPNSRSAALPLLFLVQSVQGHVTDEGMREVAEILGLTPAQVLATASFYTMLKKRPQGDYLVSVCRNISCTHLGARRVIAAAEKELGIETGETTDDGRFSLEAAECLGTCDGAPSMQINYEDFYKVTPDEVIELIGRLRDGEEVRSVRGEVVKTSTEIARETALAGVRRESEDLVHAARTVGGESQPTDMAPGFRPRVEGESDA